MGQPQARKSRKHKNGNHPLHRTRNYGRDIDQIHQDLSEQQKTLIKNTAELDEDKPGLGQFYCVECARYFTDEGALTKHRGSKVHKRRLKQLDQGPYTQKDAEAAIGLRTDRGAVSEKMDVR